MLQKYFGKLLTYDFYLISSNTAQRGQSTAYIIILVIIVIFAVMLSGGGHSLFTGNVPSSITDTPTPGADATPTASPSATWDLAVANGKCIHETIPIYVLDLTAKGPNNGKINIEVKDGNDFKQIATEDFASPKDDFIIRLSNTDQFNSKPWRITLTSNGEVKKTYEGEATNCQ